MDHVTYDEEGNPVVGRRVRSRSQSTTKVSRPEKLVGIFEIEGASYDVVVDDSKVSWVPLTGSAKGKLPYNNAIWTRCVPRL